MLMDCVEDTHDGIGKNVSLHTHTRVLATGITLQVELSFQRCRHHQNSFWTLWENFLQNTLCGGKSSFFWGSFELKRVQSHLEASLVNEVGIEAEE